MNIEEKILLLLLSLNYTEKGHYIYMDALSIKIQIQAGVASQHFF